MPSTLTIVPRSWIYFVLAAVVALTAGRIVVAQEEAATDTQPTEQPAAEEQAAQAAAPITPEQATAAATAGEEALQSGDFEKALQAYNVVYQWGAQNAFSEQGAFAVMIAFTGRGQALVGLNEYEAALEEFKNALDQNRNFTPALVARGN